MAEREEGATLTNGSSQSSLSHVSSLRRLPSRPFLRKPVPPQTVDHDADSSSTPSNSSHPPRSTSLHPSSQHSSNNSSHPPRTSLNHPYSSVANSDDAGRLPTEKPDDDAPESSLERHLTLFDLITIGVGGTIGSGLFVLAGLVANEYAGPSTVISWAVSGLAACVSGCCYAELSGRIPLAGSAYAYSYVAMGELPAILAATCLSLEYIAAAAAVARSWGDKCVAWLTEELHEGHWIHDYLGTDGFFSPLAFVISAATIVLLLNGVKESKLVTNIFTSLKVAVVLFMVVAGFCYVRPSNWSPFLPMGVSGVIRGATGTFFGYLGYDNVCCLAGEAINPKRNLPIAVVCTLVGVTLLYMIATLALTGMQPWEDISPVSGFPQAFYAVNARVIAQITSLGEILTLPIVVLISIMAQPRLQYAMAEDGLLPPFFRELDSSGNMWKGTFVAGSIMVLIATFIPFKHLNDMISCAVLSALSMTDTSLILLWYEPLDPASSLTELLVITFHAASVVTGVAVTRFLNTWPGYLFAAVGTGCMILSAYGINKFCPRSDVFGGHRQHRHGEQIRTDDGYFRTPFLPFWPCIGIAVNWYLIAHLELIGVGGLSGFLIVAIIYYFIYARHHSVANHSLPQHDSMEEEHEEPPLEEENGKLTRSISLPEIHRESVDSAGDRVIS